MSTSGLGGDFSVDFCCYYYSKPLTLYSPHLYRKPFAFEHFIKMFSMFIKPFDGLHKT